MKVSILTLGCKVNQSESSLIEANLRTHGLNIVDLKEGPDYCIINTCSVTSKSDYQSRQLIRRAHNAGSKVIVTGCYSELNKDTVKHMEGVSGVYDNLQKDNIISVLTGQTSCNTLSYSGISKSRFFLKVQDGCNHSCTYCVIPMTRGKSRSVKMEDVIERISMASDIYSEVVLCGIHLGTYGYDFATKVKLYDLLKAVLLKTKVKRVRLSSLEVKEIDDDLLDLIQDKRVCKHLHIPLQSGDDNILKNMNRNYDSRGFFDMVNNIYKVVPEVSIGTDVIAGFPGENEREFENTKQLIESLPISYIHVFPYSVRKGTKASAMRKCVDHKVKKDRCAALRELGKRKKEEYMQKQIGRTLDLVIEETYDENSVVGITGNYLKLKSYIDRPIVKDIVYVRVAEVKEDMLFGHPIEG